jgi:DNA ligase 1
VMDGELLVWLPHQALPQSFADLAQRTTRKKLSAKFLEQSPVVFMAYDLLAFHRLDYRQHPLHERRRLLEQLYAAAPARSNNTFKLSPLVPNESWDELDQLRQGARAKRVEGFMLKHKDSAYGIGRTKSTALGEWLKWKLDPMSVDAVLIYAQAGHGRRASLYTDYTFAVWGENGQLLPFAKAYSGLTDQEIRKVDAIIKKTTVDKFGPVRSVTPTLVFEIGFEGIQASPRHKAGIAVRFPRILRWRLDKTVEQADSINALRALMV